MSHGPIPYRSYFQPSPVTVRGLMNSSINKIELTMNRIRQKFLNHFLASEELRGEEICRGVVDRELSRNIIEKTNAETETEFINHRQKITIL